MSLNRLALRLAVIEALAPSAAHENPLIAWPTLAGDAVYDSDTGPMDTIEGAAKRPRLVVYTEDGRRAAESGQLDRPSSGKSTCTLAVEMFIPGFVPGEDGLPVADLAVPTDALTEAMLDLLGAQVIDALEKARMTGPLRLVLLGVERIEHRGWRDPDTALRLSSHRLEFEVMIAQQHPLPPFTALAGGLTVEQRRAALLARLPTPLSEVAAALAPGSYGDEIAQALAVLLVQPAVLPDLLEMRLAGNLARIPGAALPPAADPEPTPPVGDVKASVSLS